MVLLITRGTLLLGLLAGLLQCGCSRPASQPLPTEANASDAATHGNDDSKPNGPRPTAVTLQLNWYPEAEHGGYYAALVHGYYRDAGLDVTILSGGPETPVLQQVARRAATFGVVNADNILFGRAQQVPVVALMAPLQISPRCLIVHESSDIQGFDDLKNMTIAMSNSNAFTQYLRHKLPLTDVKIVPYPGNVAQFLLNKDYAQQGYVFSEPFVARKEGGDPKVLMLADLGYNPYTSLLFSHDDLVREDPELVYKMTVASIRGWAHYIQNPAETNQHIHHVNAQMDLDILEYGANAIKPLVLDAVAEHEGIGAMSQERWQTLIDQLVESKQLKPEAVRVDEVFTARFLQRKK